MAADVLDNMFLKESFEAPSSTVERAVQVGNQLINIMGTGWVFEGNYQNITT